MSGNTMVWPDFDPADRHSYDELGGLFMNFIPLNSILEWIYSF